MEQPSSELEKGLKVLVIYGGGPIKRNGVYDDVMSKLKSLSQKCTNPVGFMVF
ncbi:hypothetical protein [Halobacillus sp. BBL2006]|uniref:hypothetical protein n=1 Tax=Halobacillus sp. BBL2006 TaxID=1543706 RepID=UPI000A50CAE6|nr:hypothetical protein [Halobacillus sp. BBL2006]